MIVHKCHLEAKSLRVISHDVAHVHLHIELLEVDGKHHQRLPWHPLLGTHLVVPIEGRRGNLGDRICNAHTEGFAWVLLSNHQ